MHTNRARDLLSRAIEFISKSIAGFCLSLAWAAYAVGAEHDPNNLSLEDLMQVEMVSGSKFSEPLNEVAAAAYVLTKEDIARMGATNIPDILQHVPGLFVAKSSANTWAIGSRGFAGIFANKLLVMIDGRSLFSPLFSGVFWDMLDLYIPDIKRIEVIRGSGSSIWGGNAINGVINIITESSVDTQGTQMYAKSGNKIERDIGSRTGFEISDKLYGRFYLKQKALKSNFIAQEALSDGQITDQWQSSSGGIRLDSFTDNDHWTLSGDYSTQDTNEINIVPITSALRFNAMDNQSWNISAAWQHIFSAKNQVAVTLQQQEQQRKSALYSVSDKMLNLEIDQNILFLQQHKLNYGLGYRHHQLNIDPGSAFTTMPGEGRTDVDIVSGYVQFEFSLSASQTLQIGNKFERHNHVTAQAVSSRQQDYHNWIPDLRYTYNLNKDAIFWMSLNHNVRIPSVFENSIDTPIATIDALSAENPTPWPLDVVVTGNANFLPEKIINVEAGFRHSYSQTLVMDYALFVSEYEHLRSTKSLPAMCQLSGSPPPQCNPIDRLLLVQQFDNQVTADSKGIEFYSTLMINQSLTVKFNYSFLDINFNVMPQNDNEAATQTYYHHNLSLIGHWQYKPQLAFDLYYQHLGGLDVRNSLNAAMPSSNNELNLNINYQLSANSKISLQLKQLLHNTSIQWFEEYPGGLASGQKQQLSIGLEVAY